MASNPISAFVRAVRQKDEWYLKITSKERSETERRWVQDAGPDLNASVPLSTHLDVSSVDAALRKLEEEAKRICYYDHCVLTSSRMLRPRGIDFASIESEVERELCFIRNAQFAIVDSSFERHDAVGVFASNGLVPASLHTEFIEEMNRLAALQPKDFRMDVGPEDDLLAIRNVKIQELINPSLYPFVADMSRLSGGGTLSHRNFETRMRTGRHHPFFSSYSWIPSTFTISADEKDAHIESYINGLGPRENFPELYRLIELLFLFALPHLKKTAQSTVNCDSHSWRVAPSVSRWEARRHLRISGTTTTTWEAFLGKQQEEKDKEVDNFKTLQQEIKSRAHQERNNENFYLSSTGQAESIAGKQYKVIVKAVDYILEGEGTYRGKWHMEGMPHERIVASAMYYYDMNQDIMDDGLALRRLRDVDADFPTFHDIIYFGRKDFKIDLLDDKAKGPDPTASEDDIVTIPLHLLRFAMDNIKEGEVPVFTQDVDCPSDWDDDFDPDSECDLSGTITIGTVPTYTEKNFNDTGRIVSLPNWIQHRMERFSYSAEGKDKSSVARRRVLCFFVVDDRDLQDQVLKYPGFSYLYPPLNPLPTTADLDMGSTPCACNKPTLRFLLCFICKRLISKELPLELVELILQFLSFGVSREDAERHSWEFNQERAAYIDQLHNISQPTSFSISDSLL